VRPVLDKLRREVSHTCHRIDCKCRSVYCDQTESLIPFVKSSRQRERCSEAIAKSSRSALQSAERGQAHPPCFIRTQPASNPPACTPTLR
jgi:hypothetical protein